MMARRAPVAKTPAKDAEERLLIEAAQRDPSRFADLYEANFERIYAFIARRVRTREEIEDLTSDVFQRALANLGRFEWRGVPFSAWLFRIAANVITDRSQRAALERGAVNSDDPKHSEEPRPEEIEHRARLFRLVNGLPEDQRRVIIMRFAEQKTIREIAEEIRRSEGAVKQLQFRGLQSLRVRLGETDG